MKEIKERLLGRLSRECADLNLELSYTRSLNTTKKRALKVKIEEIEEEIRWVKAQ